MIRDVSSFHYRTYTLLAGKISLLILIAERKKDKQDFT